MNLLFLLILRIVSNPLINVFQKKISIGGTSSLVINTTTYFILSLVCGFSLFFIKLAPVPLEVLIYALLGGMFGAVGNACLVKALSCGELSVLVPVNSYKSVVAMLVAVFFLKEIPSVIGVCGILFIIAGSYFIFDTLEEGFSLKLFTRKDIRYRVMATIFTAIEAVFIKQVILLSSPVISFLFWCWFGFFFSCLLLIFLPTSGLKQIINVRFYICLVFCVAVMQLSTNYIFENMNVSYALALFQLSSILSVLFGKQFFQEQNIFKKMLGAVTMIIGAVAIILG